MNTNEQVQAAALAIMKCEFHCMGMRTPINALTAQEIARVALEAASGATPADPALDPATVEAGIARLIAQEFCQASDFKVGGTEIFHVRDWRRAMRVAAGVRFFINEQGSDHAQD